MRRTRATSRSLLKALPLVGAAWALGAVPALAKATADLPKRPPNVVVIVADDAGFADFGFQGSRQFSTPNLDRFAADGVRYTQAYAAMPFCSPSRAALITGRYPQRYGYEFNLTQAAPPGVDARYMGLDVHEQTMGSLFKQAGYVTIAVGKWHMGDAPQFHPNVRGFDHFYGFLGGHSDYFPVEIKPGTIQRDGVPVAAQDYLTDDFEREADRYIEANRDHPFLLYLAFNAVHTPMDARADDQAKFAGIADPQRRRLAAMTLALDRGVGSVLATLHRLGLDDNTLVVFTNDNGGDRVGLDASNAPLRGTKGTLLEGGIRVPLVVRFPDGHGKGTTRDDPVSLMDILPTALEAAGLPAPSNLDGRSLALAPLASGQRPLFWRYDVMGAMRSGPWKLLRYPDRPPELYNLDRDIAERHNLAARNPGVLKRMLNDLFAWEAGVQHPRWNTGTFWSQEDVRRYSDRHVTAEIAKSKAEIAAKSREPTGD